MNIRDLADHGCNLCGETRLREYLDYSELSRVSSDSKPYPAGGRIAVCTNCGTIQKPADERWLGEIDKIYREFTIYHQSGGAEQPIFEIGGAEGKPRSSRLMDYITSTLDLPRTGKILDFGCGNGAALAEFGKLRPDWELYGSELSDLSLPQLQAIPNFRKLFTVPPEQIGEKFDLIMLVHALEHVLDPPETLSGLSGLLAPGGRVFVEIPNVEQTPYDLLVADHKTHFTLQSLGYAAALAGFENQILSDGILPKELTWIGKPASNPDAVQPPSPEAGIDLLERHLAWIVDQAAQARQLAESRPRLGVFGTSISATWLFGLLRDRIAFFVDEDRGRIGRKHMGLPVLAPDQVAEGSDVFVPLVPKIAEAVVRRLDRSGVAYHVPKPITHS